MLRLFCFALLCFAFCLYAFAEASALRSIALRYAGAPIATRVSFFFFLFFWRCRFFRVFFPFFVPFPLSLCTVEYVVRSFLPNGVFYLVTTGWIFYISLSCENSTKSINHIEGMSWLVPVADNFSTEILLISVEFLTENGLSMGLGVLWGSGIFGEHLPGVYQRANEPPSANNPRRSKVF